MTDRSPLRPGFALAVLAAAALAPASLHGQDASADGDDVHDSARHRFGVVPVAEGLEHPWSLAWLPGGDLLVTERPGRLRVVRDGVLDPEPVSGTPEVWARGQGGLLEVLPHPDFESNRLVYLSFSKPGPDGEAATTAVVRGRLAPDGGSLSDVEEIFEARAWVESPVHFGGRMIFDGEGHLFLSVGDRGDDPDLLEEHAAQSLENHQGTILRLLEDGRVPDDNPFVGRDDALPEIWSYGHRNPQGLTLHPETGALWSNEHGPRGGDEVNVVRPGRNYGWPVASYGVNYDGSIYTLETDRPGMEPPIYTWVPSIATSGMTFYTGDRFPWWRGNAFVGGLGGQQLARLIVSGEDVVSEETLLAGELGRIRDVRQGPDGHIYLAVEDRTGEPTPVVRLEPVEGGVESPSVAR